MDREKVIEGLRDIDMFIAGRLGHEKAKKFLRTIDETIALLKEQEAEIEQLKRFVNGFSRDAVPVVRCKDCKNLGYTNSHWFCKWLNRCVDEDWYCADGERKE